MGNDKIQRDLLQYIADYNDGKIKVKDSDGKEKYSKDFKEGISHKKYIGSWLKLKFVDGLEYDEEKINENLRLLSEDKKIIIVPNENNYIETESPIALTSLGYKELSLSKRYPLEWRLGIILTITSIILTIINIINRITHFIR